MIELQQHQTSWADEFRREAKRVARALGARVDVIEHIGSTAVPGLVAKPIIDLAARAASDADPFALDAPLSEIDYRPHRTGPKNHAVYVRTRQDRRTHILHVFTADQWMHCHQRLFRDKLLHDPSARRRYGRLKESLALLDDGREYTAAKRALVEELVNEERAARGMPAASAWDK